MNILGRVSVFPTLPEPIQRLEELAYNLWWAWTPEAQALWKGLDPALWESIYHNPVKFMRDVSQEKLNAAATDATYLKNYAQVTAAFDEYMAAGNSWFKHTYPEHAKDGMQIAYFSAEFGLHESLPIYSGGLGILSGDHCKAASDLDLPFIGVGFLYPQGYFQQRIGVDGMQEAVYNKFDLNEVPARPALDANGKPVIVQVELPGRTVSAQVWTIRVGRITLLMLDTDVDPNAPSDRVLAARLYGGDHEIRISQEIILGIGGVRALQKLGYNPTVWHMNEGHSAFMGLERVRQLVQDQKLTFAEAVEVVRSSCIFTTHTPVPAGNDAFPFELVERYFYNYWPKLSISREDFLLLARHDMGWGPQFSMTVLALELSGQANGVSELHGQVSRDMWKDLWPNTPVDEVPITHITNGVHQQSWVHPDIEALFDRHFPAHWRDEMDSPELWAKARELPDAELWQIRRAMKHELVEFVRERVSAQFHRQGRGPIAVRYAEKLLDPEALTLGFARRFATYKRATLIFRDMERLKRILNHPERPVQIIFSGKSHPADQPGKELIMRIVQLSREAGLEGKIVFVEDYDMNVARHLVAGVDIWLNTPRRPLEASGTSGQKAAMNGAPNFSILDGWWREGWDGKNGWAIGEERVYRTPEEQDEADVLSLYTTLEDEIVPLYYESQGEDGAAEWLQIVKESIATITPRFSMRRMVKDYTTQLYVPAQEAELRLEEERYRYARDLAQWKQRIRDNWAGVQLEAQYNGTMNSKVGEPLPIVAHVRLGALRPEDVCVEIVTGTEAEEQLRHPTRHPMTLQGQLSEGIYRYEGTFTPTQSGRQAYGVRVLPTNDLLMHPQEMGKVLWA
ncbi:MAG: alpha-glucan family phosphorylase [Ardenticatenales bacterium]|nr:alpha-glucan family phosphorylase [Ardenticatenales bacterium]